MTNLEMENRIRNLEFRITKLEEEVKKKDSIDSGRKITSPYDLSSGGKSVVEKIRDKK